MHELKFVGRDGRDAEGASVVLLVVWRSVVGSSVVVDVLSVVRRRVVGSLVVVVADVAGFLCIVVDFDVDVAGTSSD